MISDIFLVKPGWALWVPGVGFYFDEPAASDSKLSLQSPMWNSICPPSADGRH